MEATIRKDDNNRVTLILDGRLDTSVTQQTEKEVQWPASAHGYQPALLRQSLRPVYQGIM